MKKRKTTNPKRQLRQPPTLPEEKLELEELASRVSYGGNPAHKRNPGDFQLTPPGHPRPGATLCDGAGVFTRAEAVGLLREGIRRGLISVQDMNGWPKNVWAVTSGGIPLEAIIENQEIGSYHGYPMLSDEPLSVDVIKRWESSRPNDGDSNAA